MASRRHHMETQGRVLYEEIERRLRHTLEELQQARKDFEQAREAVHAQEQVLLLRRFEREQAALRVAELAELAESLQHDMLLQPVNK